MCKHVNHVQIHPKKKYRQLLMTNIYEITIM